MGKLVIKFDFWQIKGQCDALYFQDSTPEGSTGYGGDNPTKGEIKRTRIYIQTPSGGTYLFDNLYLPKQSRPLTLYPQMFTASRLIREDVLADPELACILNANAGGVPDKWSISRFDDGCYNVLYEVFSDVKVPARKCTYEAFGPWQTGWSFWALRNGADYNLTSSLTILDGEFLFRAEKTTNEHTFWRVKDGEGKTVHSGDFTKYDCFNSISAVITTPEPVVVAASNIEHLSTCRVEQRQSFGAHKLIIGKCHNLPKGLDEDRALAMYTLASDKLTIIQNRGEGCNCDCGNYTLKEINSIFDYLNL